MAERPRARRFPIVWLIASAMALIVYLYSIGWRSELTSVRDDRLYRLLLHDGALAGYAVDVDNWADQTSGFVEPVTWSLELKLLPAVRRNAAGGWAAELPLWLFALPVWIITFITWRRWRRYPRGCCPKCGYDLNGLPLRTQRCPECGALRPGAKGSSSQESQPGA